MHSALWVRNSHLLCSAFLRVLVVNSRLMGKLKNCCMPSDFVNTMSMWSWVHSLNVFYNALPSLSLSLSFPCMRTKFVYFAARQKKKQQQAEKTSSQQSTTHTNHPQTIFTSQPWVWVASKLPNVWSVRWLSWSVCWFAVQSFGINLGVFRI